MEMSTGALCLRSWRDNRRAHSNPVNPLPTITTEVLEVMPGAYPLWAGQQRGELRCVPRLPAARAKLAPQDRRPLRDSTVAEQQKCDGICGDHAVGFRSGGRDDGCSPVDRHPVVVRSANSELEADLRGGRGRPQIFGRD